MADNLLALLVVVLTDRAKPLTTPTNDKQLLLNVVQTPHLPLVSPI